MSARPEPGTPEWCALVTASKVPALLGLSPWDSPLSMWLKMAGRAPWDAESQAMRRGNMLENAVLDWWLADNPNVSEMERQPWHQLQDETWCGATPDMRVIGADGEPEFVDAKTTTDDEEAWWDGPPAHYLTSSMWQLAMAPHVQRVRLAVLFGRRLTLRTFTVERDDELCGALIDRAREFHLSLAADEPPPLSGMACEYDAIRKAHPEIDRGETATIPADLAAEYVTAYRATKALPAIQAAVLDAMGRAQYAADPDGNRIARRQPSNGDAVALYFAARTPATEETAA
jgi:predicted phage-related endonuclease